MNSSSDLLGLSTRKATEFVPSPSAVPWVPQPHRGCTCSFHTCHFLAISGRQKWNLIDRPWDLGRYMPQFSASWKHQVRSYNKLPASNRRILAVKTPSLDQPWWNKVRRSTWLWTLGNPKFLIFDSDRSFFPPSQKKEPTWSPEPKKIGIDQ